VCVILEEVRRCHWLSGLVLCLYRQTVSMEDACNKTLNDYLKFENEMSVVSVVWKECKRLIEAYNEQQVTLLSLHI